MTFKEERLKEGVTVAAYAKKLGVSVSTIRRLDAGGKVTGRTFAKSFYALPRQSQLSLIEIFTQDAHRNKYDSVISTLGNLKELILKKIDNEGQQLAA